MRQHAAMAVLLGATALGACTPPEAQVGRAIYQENCVVCHGPAGKGDGPAAGGLDPAPADLTRIAARNGGVFPWARVMGHIDGYKRRDRAGEMMPEFGARMQGPTVLFDSGDGIMTPTPKPLVDLARYLESIQQ